MQFKEATNVKVLQLEVNGQVCNELEMNELVGKRVMVDNDVKVDNRGGLGHEASLVEKVIKGTSPQEVSSSNGRDK